MKYLISENFKVLQKGEFVSTSKFTEDFIYDTDLSGQHPSATMREIANENGLKVKGKKTSEIFQSLNTLLATMPNIPERNKMSTTEKVNIIVKNGFDEEKSEDEILVEIVQSGIKFQTAIKMMKHAKVDLGLSISSEDRWKECNSIMEDDEFEPSEYSEVSGMAKELCAEVKSTSEKQALAMIRKFCKANEIEIPKKPKSTGACFAVKAMAWMFENMDSTVDQFEEWLEDEMERTEKVVARNVRNFVALKALMAK